MEDKRYDLLEKMYTDLSGKIDCVNSEILEIKISMTIKSAIVGFEHKIDKNYTYDTLLREHNISRSDLCGSKTSNL